MPKRLAKEPTIKWLSKGNVVANCTSNVCPRGTQHIDQFVPVVSNQNHKQRAAFLKIVRAIESINDVLADQECMKILNEANLTRMKRCLTCRLMITKSQRKSTTKAGECRANGLRSKTKRHD